MISEENHRRLSQLFATEFGSVKDTHLVRAPGRVNLIGDHTDYNGLPAFPMAIQREIAILFRKTEDGHVRLRNINPRFEAREFQIEPTIAAYRQGDWGNYAKAAAQALARRFGMEKGFDAVVASDIPAAAGLSSSSALLVACALILVRINAISIDLLDLMELLAQGEHYVGTQGGGMDQAACLGGHESQALKIDFSPLRISLTPVPHDWCFVIAHSLAIADKSGKTRESYNARPLECREALRRFLSHPAAHRDVQTYSNLLSRIPIPALLSEAEQVLEQPYRGRFCHVVSEAERVEAARRAMLARDLAGFGSLMNESHSSLRDDLEVSCQELDHLVAACLEAGGCGARMTGAGFGGCAVTLCTADQSFALQEELKTSFYRTRILPAGMQDCLITARPAAGAGFLY